MIALSENTPIYLCKHPVDFRCGIDSLAALCRKKLQKEPRCGAIFVFINRNRTQIRALSYQGNGFYLLTKRLSRGFFSHLPVISDQIVGRITSKQLRLLLNNQE